MHVIWGEEYLEELQGEYTFLELDTYVGAGSEESIRAFAVLESKDIRVETLAKLDHWLNFHADFLINYRKQNWDFCHQAIEHLIGKFGKSMNEYYETMDARIIELSEADLPDDWRGYFDLQNKVVV